MLSQQSFFETVLGSSFGTPAFTRGIRTDVCIDLVAELNGALAMAGTAQLSGAGNTGSCALRRTLPCHALPSTSVAVLVVIGSIKKQHDFSLLPYLNPFQCGTESEIPSTLGNMRPSGYYAWDTKAMIP